MCTAEELKVCEETMAAHKERLKEISSLVAEIAANVGLDENTLLQGEVEALGKQLEDVRESITTLADVAETRAQTNEDCNDQLNNTKTFLNSVQKTLIDVDKSNEKDTEAQLVALRNHLLALGKTEGQIQTIKEKSLDFVQNKTTQTSVVEILHLWQNVFRETFQQYHRLSTRLVRSEDGAAALRLWQEYLLHVQSFLSGNIPEDYNGLTEHQHLCEVHQNLLSSQGNVLLSKNKDTDSKLGGGLVDLSVMEQFDSLTNLHNETLARIMERHIEVKDRIASWESYRTDQAKLLAWLESTEKERKRLQLRYLHLRRVPKILNKIKWLLEKIPLGEKQCEDLKQQQKKILMFCDEDALATSIRMEHAAISQRISNLHAGLETWRGFIERIIHINQEYDSQIAQIQTIYQDIQQSIQNSQLNSGTVSHSGIQNKLDILRANRTRVTNTGKDIEKLGILQEQLKECVSPSDMKMINQRLWLLVHQQGDLDHQLSSLIHLLEERFNLRAMFETRQTRFINWASQLESRLQHETDKGIIQDPEEIIKKLETELQSELVLKERELEWILKTGQELLEQCDNQPDDRLIYNNVQGKLNEVQDIWQRLQDLSKTKANKIHDMIQTKSKLEIRIAEIRAWLKSIESQLATPLTFEACTKDVIDRKLQEHDKLKKEIEKESGNIGDVLNLCELLLSDVDTWKVYFNTDFIRSAVENLEKRWKLVCGASAERKRKIKNVWTLLQEVLRLSVDQEEWLLKQEKQLQEMESSMKTLSREQIQDRIRRLENQMIDIEARGPALTILEQTYSRLAKASGLELENLQQLTSNVRIMLTRWHSLTPKAMSILQKLKHEIAIYRDFVTAHGKAVVSLTHVDAQLTQLQHLAGPELEASPKHRLQQVEKLASELESYSTHLQNADQLGTLVMQRIREDEIASIQEMIDEYQLLWKDILERITHLKQRIQIQIKEHSELQKKQNEVDESVQVETLKFEQDTAVQVNTLPPLVRLTSITSKDAYIYELDSAIRECTANIDSFEVLVGSAMPSQGSPEIQTSGKTLAKLIATCQSSVELVKHLNQLLLTESNCTDEQARSVEVQNLISRFEEILIRARIREQKIRELSEAGRLLCPLCTRRNWQQLENDLWRLEQWLLYAESTQENQHSAPSNIEQLEDVIQDHREFLLNLDSHRSIVVSLNIVGTHLADHTEDIARADDLRSRLVTINKRWDTVCLKAAAWQTLLQTALMNNHEFHQTIDELCTWLEKTEMSIRASEPVDITADTSVIDTKYEKFVDLRAELERCEPRVMSLQEAADQLLRHSEAPEGSSLILTRLTDLRLRLQSLRRLTGVYILKLGAVLGRDPNEIGITLATPASSVETSLHSLSYDLLDQAAATGFDAATHNNQHENGNIDDAEINTSVLRRGYRFLGRVVRASLPIQALMLLLLGVASLVPTVEDDYSCTLTNTLSRSFEPVLRYNNGPPPV